MPSKPTYRTEQRDPDPNVDRYPTLVKAMRRIIEEGDFEDGPIERLEVTCLASGEATYRYWPARAEDPEGGYLPKV